LFPSEAIGSSAMPSPSMIRYLIVVESLKGLEYEGLKFEVWGLKGLVIIISAYSKKSL